MNVEMAGLTRFTRSPDTTGSHSILINFTGKILQVIIHLNNIQINSMQTLECLAAGTLEATVVGGKFC